MRCTQPSSDRSALHHNCFSCRVKPGKWPASWWREADTRQLLMAVHQLGWVRAWGKAGFWGNRLVCGNMIKLLQAAHGGAPGTSWGG